MNKSQKIYLISIIFILSAVATNVDAANWQRVGEEPNGVIVAFDTQSILRDSKNSTAKVWVRYEYPPMHPCGVEGKKMPRTGMIPYACGSGKSLKIFRCGERLAAEGEVNAFTGRYEFRDIEPETITERMYSLLCTKN